MITVLDDTMRIVDILRKYEYSQYEYKAREIGTFTINAMLDKENLYLMDKTKNYYVLLDHDVFGIIESIKRESDSETSKVFTIKGSLALKLLEYRVIKGQVTFKGKSYKYIEELVKQNLIMSDDENRNIALAVEFENEERLKQVCSMIDKQVTGGSLWDEISEVAEADKLRIALRPNVVVINTEHPQNIDGWTLIIGAGEDRTRHRTDKTVSSVVFSQSLSNIANTDYTVDRSKLRNTVYIAGEGEGTDRKWYNIDVNSDVTFGERKGWNRKELWVDARDVQSEQDSKKLTDAEYEELMKQRADEKAKDNDLSEEYTATVTDIAKQYTYKKDYNIGDFVTVADEELSMEIDAQITNVIVTRQNDRDIVDIEFTYGSRIKDVTDIIQDVINKVQNNATTVKYLENRSGKTATQVFEYIVEEGENDNGHYRKWSSGLLEQWVSDKLITAAINNSYGSLYQGIFSWIFPIQFLEKPEIVICSKAQYGTGASWGTIYNWSASSVNIRAFDTFSRASANEMRFIAYAKGKWK
nr:MAG TPA: hypothetical protein [Caudoviricetes sp.]